MTPATSKRGSSIVGASADTLTEGFARPPKKRKINHTGPSKQTMVFPRKTHTRMVEYGREHGITLQDIFADMANEWLVKRGFPPMYDAEGSEQ